MWTCCLLFILLCCNLPVEQARSTREKCPRKRISLRGQSGNFSTPGYPGKYISRQTCIWTITVRKGYRVRIYFAKKFGITKSSDCASDSLVLSTRRQRFRNQPGWTKGPHTEVFCGRAQPSNVTAPGRSLWVRFETRSVATDVGFKAFYEAIDENECEPAFGEQNGGCDQLCVNNEGSYFCACRVGYRLLSNGKSCEEIVQQRLSFTKPLYEAFVSRHAPVSTRVTQVKAIVEATAKSRVIFYTILSENGAPNERKFTVELFTGIVRLRGRIENESDFRLIVEGQVDEFSKNTTVVLITVADTDQPSTSQNALSLEFPRSSYSVIISEDITPGSAVFQAKALARNKYGKVKRRAEVRYALGEDAPEIFEIDRTSGEVKVKGPFNFNQTESAHAQSTTFNFTIKAFLAESPTQEVKVNIRVIVIPEYAGNSYVETVIRSINPLDILKSGGLGKGSTGRKTPKPASPGTEDLSKLDRDRSRSQPNRVGNREFQLHRWYRQLSPQARKISQSELVFSRVVRELRRTVTEKYAAGRLRSSLVSSNLGLSSLADKRKLAKVVITSACTGLRANCSDTEYHTQYRTLDGSCNNLETPLWGAAPMPFARMLDPVYFDPDGLSDPVGFPGQIMAPPMPSPDLVSREFIIHSTKSEAASAQYSHMLMQWGQFLDHDISFTPESEGSDKCQLPRCDRSPEDYEPPCFPILFEGGKECTMFTRSAAACQDDEDSISPREQLNTVTSFIDGSQIYGSSLSDAQNLRDIGGFPGFLKTTVGDLPPYVKDPLHAPLNLCEPIGGCFDTGDPRSNVQVGLASMHTLWIREHNRIARELMYVNNHWEPDRFYHEARKIVGAMLQHITYTEYLPKLLGSEGIPKYEGYRDVNPSIFNVFAAAAYRMGHSMVRSALLQLNENYDPIGPEIPLVKAFFNTKLIQKTGIEPFLYGMLGNVSQDVDRRITSGLTKQLFQQPESSHGFNLAALNIQRGRDHGLPGYGAWRRKCNLANADTFSDTKKEITDPEARRLLSKLYDDIVEHADLWVAGLAEEPLPGNLLGPTLSCIIRKQFIRLRDGDRFWYENPTTFSEAQLKEIRKVTLARVMCNNMKGIVSIQRDAFLAVTKNDRRVACDQIPAMDLYSWTEVEASTGSATENPTEPAKDDPWSAWINTVSTPTGSWGVVLGRKICNGSVLDIECQQADGKPYSLSGEKVTCLPTIGVYCRNFEQDDGKICSQYRFRLKCSDIPKPVVTPVAHKGFPLDAKEPIRKCNTRRHPRDFPLIFDAAKEVNLENPYSSLLKQEYLLAGKEIGTRKKRFLIQFDLRRIPRQAIIHSAELHLFLVYLEHNTTSNISTPQNFLEAYQVLSSDWHMENTTTLVPWNQDYLGIGSDLREQRLSRSEDITRESSHRWIKLDVTYAVYRWRTGVSLQPNYGFLVKAGKEDSARYIMRLASTSHKNPRVRPKLFVCLTMPQW